MLSDNHPWCFPDRLHCCLCCRSSLQQQRRPTRPFRTARPAQAAPRGRKQLQCRAGNLLVELIGSSVGAAAVTAVTTFTSEKRDDEIERLQVNTAALAG